MDEFRQHFFDTRIEKNKESFLKFILSHCLNNQEAVYVTCSLALDYMRMNYKAIQNAVPTQEAKAAFKIAMDAFLVEYGMSIAIHEFV